MENRKREIYIYIFQLGILHFTNLCARLHLLFSLQAHDLTRISRDVQKCNLTVATFLCKVIKPFLTCRTRKRVAYKSKKLSLFPARYFISRRFSPYYGDVRGGTPLRGLLKIMARIRRVSSNLHDNLPLERILIHCLFRLNFLDRE